MESWTDSSASGKAMRPFYCLIVYHPRLILVLFAVLVALSAVCMPMVGVNYDMNDYLPEDSPSTVALDVMEEEFDGGIPNARVMLCDVSIAEALRYKDMLSAVEGVSTYDLMDTITADMGKVNAVSIGAVFLVLLLSMKSLLLPVILVLDIEAAI